MEAEKRAALLDILTHRFSQDELRTLAFVIRGVGAFDDLRGETREAKAVSLLELLSYRRRLKDLLRYIQEFRSDIDLSALGLEQEPASPPRIEFVNRRSEIQQITDRRAPQYQVVDGPAGYGKTKLLQEIVRRYQSKGWLCVYVEIPHEGPFSLPDVVTAIAEVGECRIDIQRLADAQAETRRMGFQVAECLLERVKTVQSLKRIRAEGIILLLDSVERLDDADADLLLNRLVPGIHEGLKRAGVQSPFKAILAGRHVAARWKELAPFISSSILLTPFSFAVVKDTVEEYTNSIGLSLSLEDVARIAAYLMHVTGGHPGGMAQILNGFQLVWLDDTFLIEIEGQHFQQVVSPIVEEVRQGQLRHSLDTLSPCRRFTPLFLRGLIQRGLIQHDDEYRLEKELTATYLVTRKHGFLHDDITRRLLAVRLRQEQPARFVEVSQAAQEIYAEQLADPRTTRPEIIAIELLYQELQVRHYRQLPATDQERTALADEFFVALDVHLDSLVAGRDAHEMLANLVTALEDDWEFQFVINYLLRQETYDERPYQDLKRRVEAFRQAL